MNHRPFFVAIFILVLASLACGTSPAPTTVSSPPTITIPDDDVNTAPKNTYGEDPEAEQDSETSVGEIVTTPIDTVTDTSVEAEPTAAWIYPNLQTGEGPSCHQKEDFSNSGTNKVYAHLDNSVACFIKITTAVWPRLLAIYTDEESNYILHSLFDLQNGFTETETYDSGFTITIVDEQGSPVPNTNLASLTFGYMKITTTSGGNFVIMQDAKISYGDLVSFPEQWSK